jgi:hypothetical protein
MSRNCTKIALTQLIKELRIRGVQYLALAEHGGSADHHA